MSDGPVLGIDLGTTNSVVAVADGGQARVLTGPEGQRMVPSVVSFHPDGETLVGYEARERRLVDAENTVYAVKRLIGRPFDSPEVKRARERFGFNIVRNNHGGSVVEVRKGRYALAEISAMVLRELRRVAEQALGIPCERAVITVPANFNELQRSATKAAGKVAGLDVLRILNEPTAAALAYGFGGGSREKVAVYDLGGGTFDITILELDDDVFEVLATAGDTFLGGEDLDSAVGDAMCDAFRDEHGWDPREDRQAFERLKAAGEWAKCQLSTDPRVELTVEDLTRDEMGAAIDLQFALTREELENIARPWLARSFAVCDEALRTAGLSAADIGSVAMVGGSTRMPLVHQMVEAYFGTTPRSDVDPDLVVAQGAAIHGYAIGGMRAEAEPSVPRPLGRVALRRVSMVKKPATMEELPRGPAFSPMERRASEAPRERPKRATDPPSGIPDLPPPVSRVPNVLAAPVIEVRTPRTTIDQELDALAPTSDIPEPGDLDDLAPPEFGPDPFSEFDPFAAPAAGGSQPAPILDSLPDALDAPFAAPEALPPVRRPIASREPTLPFAIEGAGTPEVVAPRPAARPPPPPPAEPPVRAPQAIARESTRAPEPRQPELAVETLAMPPVAPPILMDVTPHSLGLETAGGYCRRLILKNTPVPTEQTRTFTTARDEQSEVAVRICQGESETFADNQILGEVILNDLPPMARGELHIEVAFILDANGTLAIEAKDAQSGRTQTTRIELRGGYRDDDIAGMRLRLEAEEL